MDRRDAGRPVPGPGRGGTRTARAIVDPANRRDLVGTDPRRLTWRRARRRGGGARRRAARHGLRQGQVLAVQLPNTIELAAAYLACWRLGIVISPLPVQYREHEINRIREIVDVAAFFTIDRVGDRRARRRGRRDRAAGAGVRRRPARGRHPAGAGPGHPRAGRDRRRLRRRAPDRPQRLRHDLLDVRHREHAEGRAAHPLRLDRDQLEHHRRARPHRATTCCSTRSPW